MRKRLINIIIYLLVYGLCISCNTNPSTMHQFISQSSSPDQYLNYDTTGYIRKYFNYNWDIVHYKSKATYYREAYYINGKIVSDRIARDYYSSGQLQFEGYIASEAPDILIGMGIWYNKDGSISIKRTTDLQGRLQGEETHYFPNGNVMERRNYKDGIPAGKYICYYENGNKKQTGEYSDGKQHGIQYEYYEDEKIHYVYTLSYGKLDGAAKEYYENGKLKAKGKYTNGIKKEIWYYYDKNGFFTKIDHDKQPYPNTQQLYYQRTTQSRSNYQELWDECEYYQDLLYENDISPYNELDYPMDYHELEDLRDELESQLQEEDIDY